MPLRIVPLLPDHADDAAALVAARYRDQRRRAPLLPARYEEPAAFRPLLAKLVAAAPGAVALRDGRLVGFLAGFVLAEFLGRRAVYSPEWGHATTAEQGRRIYEELYAHLSAQWAADGCAIHVLTLLANDEAGLEAWRWLGFGLAGVDGLRGLQPAAASGAAVSVRQATAQDVDQVRAFARALERHMASPPTFWPHELQDYAEWVQGAGGAVWLALEGEQPLGCMAVGPANPEACEVIQDPRTASIILAYTHQTARGRGIATALLNRSLAWAKAQGYQRCAVDFESMNIPAARFWMQWFEPICYSLLRTIPKQTVGVPDAQSCP